MHYKLVIFGVKETTLHITDFIREIFKVDLVVTLSDEGKKKNHISGVADFSSVESDYGTEVLRVDSYTLNDESTKAFFKNNTFDVGIAFGWQRLIPESILDVFSVGVFGFHGSSGYLPFGRGRSPLNWSIISGDKRFVNNMIRYDKFVDSPNVFANEVFTINEFDNIMTLQAKNIISSKKMITKLINDYQKDSITIDTSTKDFDMLYKKRTPSDGLISFKSRTSEIYNLIRATTKPFPGAFSYINGCKVTIWEAHPFDNVIDLSSFYVLSL